MINLLHSRAQGMRVSLCACLTLLSCGALAAPSWPTSEPYWPHYPTRGVQVLTGNWSFGFSASVDPSTVSYADAAALAVNATAVPGSFDVAPMGVQGPRGAAIYVSQHSCTPGSTSLLKFGAVNFYARVFVDGSAIGNHSAGGYTPFQMVTPPCGSSGMRELLVATSNDDNQSPLCITCTGGDFYFYGGIIRPVIVTELPSAKYWIDRVEPITTDIINGLITVNVVIAGPEIPPSVHLTLAFNGGSSGPSQDVPVGAGGVATLTDVAVPNFKLWSVGAGNLYTLKVSDGVIGDAIEIRSGLRIVAVNSTSGRLTINGETVKLLGFNRHTMWPDTGAAVTPAQEAADLALLQKLNSNYVRGAHYPQGPGVSTKDTLNPAFMASHLQAMTEMITTSIAHPCVILHAFFNEGPSDNATACKHGYKPSADLIRSLVGTPPSRLVTWANNKLSRDTCIASEDVISFNQYPGWYNDAGNVSAPAAMWAENVQWVVSNWPQKAFTISETGGGGIFEWTNDTYADPGLFWSQKYQKNVVSADARFAAASDAVSGLTLWQFSDIKVANCGPCVYGPHPDTLSEPWDCAYIDPSELKCGRPKGQNNKGIVDFWRRPKEDFPVIAGIYNQA